MMTQCKRTPAVGVPLTTLYFRIRHSFAHLRPVILSADWSISRLQSWTCSSLPTVAEFVKLTQSFVIEIQRQSADLCKVQLCNRQFFVVSILIYVVEVYECHPLARPSSNSNPVSYWPVVVHESQSELFTRTSKLSSLFSAFRKYLKLQNGTKMFYYVCRTLLVGLMFCFEK